MPALPPAIQQATLPPFANLGGSHMMPMGLSHAAASQMAANMAAARMQAAMAQTGCVILVSNLDEEVRTSLTHILLPFHYY